MLVHKATEQCFVYLAKIKTKENQLASMLNPGNSTGRKTRDTLLLVELCNGTGIIMT